MEPLSDLFINNLLRTNEQGILFQREDDQVEYKAIFDNSSKEAKAKYAKELAALYNCKGGYLIFGVDDKTNKLVGLAGFSEPDNADLSIVINGYFSPTIPFKTMVKAVDQKEVFIIYVPKRELIPTICQKNHQSILTKSTIYWRYSGQAAPIEPGDLQNLFNGVRGEESKKQTEIAEKAYRAQYRPLPYLAFCSDGVGSNEMRFHLRRRGKMGFITKTYVGNIGLPEANAKIYVKYDMEGLDIANFTVVSVRSNTQSLRTYGYSLFIEYRDVEYHEYRVEIVYRNGNATMQKPIEL